MQEIAPALKDDIGRINSFLSKKRDLPFVYREAGKEDIFSSDYPFFNLPPYNKDCLDDSNYKDFLRAVNAQISSIAEKYNVPEKQIAHQFAKKRLRSIDPGNKNSSDQNIRMLWAFGLRNPQYGNELSKLITKETIKIINGNWGSPEYKKCAKKMRDMSLFFSKWETGYDSIKSEDFPEDI